MRRKRLKTGNSSIQLLFCFLLMSQVSGALSLEEQNKVTEVGDGFENMMLSHLYGQMRDAGRVLNVGDDSPFAPSRAEKIYRSMREEEMMKSLAKSRPLGFGKLVERQLLGQQGIGDLVQKKKVGSAERNLVESPQTGGLKWTSKK